jgi:uncharacterized membrane protein YfcA
MWNILLGILFIIGGLSGNFVLRGTDNSELLVLIGVALAIYGGYQVLRRRQA